MIPLFGYFGETRQSVGFDRCLDEALHHGGTTTTNPGGGGQLAPHTSQLERLFRFGCWIPLTKPPPQPPTCLHEKCLWAKPGCDHRAATGKTPDNKRQTIKWQAMTAYLFEPSAHQAVRHAHRACVNGDQSHAFVPSDEFHAVEDCDKAIPAGTQVVVRPRFPQVISPKAPLFLHFPKVATLRRRQVPWGTPCLQRVYTRHPNFCHARHGENVQESPPNFATSTGGINGRHSLSKGERYFPLIAWMK